MNQTNRDAGINHSVLCDSSQFITDIISIFLAMMALDLRGDAVTPQSEAICHLPTGISCASKMIARPQA
jgi:hypothetical protein